MWRMVVGTTNYGITFYYSKLRYLAKYKNGYIKGEFMSKKQQIMRMLESAKKKQKEAAMLLEEAMKVVSLVMDVESLEDVEIEKLNGQARKIISDYLKDNGNLLKEENQRDLFSKLHEVNYKRQGLIYIFRDLGIKTKYVEPETDDPLRWKSIEILGDVDG